MTFGYDGEELCWNTLPLGRLAREIYDLNLGQGYEGPFYLYSEPVLRHRISKLRNALPDAGFYYSVKSSSNPEILRILREYEGFGLDVVSSGEIERGLRAGFTASQMVFAGVGKTKSEIRHGLECGIAAFHVESQDELELIARVARELSVIAPVAIRVNPDVEVDTHKYITTGRDENKFGLSLAEVRQAILFIKMTTSLRLVGLQAHIGSQLRDTEPHRKTLSTLTSLAYQAENELKIRLRYISAGGGFGIDYTASLGESPEVFDLATLQSAVSEADSRWPVHFEPGRFISAPAGILITRVLYIKEKPGFKIAITDAGMTELIRPALYQAVHPVLPLKRREGHHTYDLAGPVCESADFFRKQVSLSSLQPGDFLAILHTGAYGSSMGSNYNSRRLAPEFMIRSSGQVSCIRNPQTYDQMFENEISKNVLNSGSY